MMRQGPAADDFRVPKSNALPFGLTFYCVEGLRLEGYRMVSDHPEWWIKDVKHFDDGFESTVEHSTANGQPSRKAK